MSHFPEIPQKEWDRFRREAKRSKKRKAEIVHHLARRTINCPPPWPIIDDELARREFQLLDEWDSSSIVSDAPVRGSYSFPISTTCAPYSLRGNRTATRFFIEEIWKAAHKDFPSPADVWANFKSRACVLQSALNVQKSWSRTTIFNAVRLRKHVVSNFRASAARHLMDTLGGGTVLDFSAGYGGRFTGFWASSCSHYIGIDPNVALCPCFEKLGGFLRERFPRPKTWEMHYRPAEDVDFSRWKDVDLVFTSPPYFNVERYSDSEGQSWKRYSTQDDWLSGFLFPVLSKAIQCVRRGGFVVLNLADSDVHRVHVCDQLCEWMKGQGMLVLPAWKLLLTSKPGSKFSVGTGRLAEPVWVFRKP